MNYGNVLIIDDKIEDGNLIGQALWKQNIPCLFFQYDEDNLLSFDSPAYSGVRVIFQDMQVVSSGAKPGSADFSAITVCLDRLLSKNNGPWLLATWSTWNDDEDLTKELFDYLIEELDKEKQPFHFLALDKGQFTNGTHEKVKNDINPDEISVLNSMITSTFDSLGSFKAMLSWEHAVQDSASNVIKDLSITASSNTPETIEKLFSQLMYTLAKYGAGGAVTDSTVLTKGFENILHTLHGDHLANIDIFQKDIFSEEPNTIDLDEASIFEWKNRINWMLHFDDSPGHKTSSGCIYEFDTSHFVPNINNGDNSFSEDNIKEQLLTKIKNKIGNNYDKFKNNAKLVAVDITPPCDHALGNAMWIKMCLGIIITMPNLDEIAPESQKKKIKSSYDADNFWISPIFSTKKAHDEKESKFLLLDLRMIFSVPESIVLTTIKRIKEQLHKEIMSNLSQHMTRPGIVNLHNKK